MDLGRNFTLRNFKRATSCLERCEVGFGSLPICSSYCSLTMHLLLLLPLRYFFVIYGQTVKIHSHATGRVVSSLSIPDESSPEDPQTSDQHICSLLLNPHNSYQLYVATFGGKIYLWDYLDAVLLQTFDLGVPIYFVRTHSRFEKVLFVACAQCKPTIFFPSPNIYSHFV